MGWSGHLVTPPSGLLDDLSKITGTRLVSIRDKGNNNGDFTLSGETAMLSLSLYSGGTEAEVSVSTSSEEILDKLNKLLCRVLLPDNPREGLVFTLARGMQGYSITRLGIAGTPLIRTNYTPNVLADYDHVVQEQMSESPCGRLTILSGEPGTGKTYLVRSLLSDAPQSAYILIPPHLVESLGSPEILPALTQAKQEFNGPIMLIIEDADHCLVKREDSNGNMNAISSMLNLGDGILGSVLDVRILATTNAGTIQMDAATRRNGRLCRHIEVGPLSPGQATAALSSIVQKPVKPFTEPTTLADVYATARRLGWAPPPKAKSPEGKYARPELV
jgi:hypothetical protein